MAIGKGGGHRDTPDQSTWETFCCICSHYLDKADLNANGHFDIDNGFKKEKEKTITYGEKNKNKKTKLGISQGKNRTHNLGVQRLQSFHQTTVAL